LIEALLQDLRYGLRMLAGKPGFTAVAIFALALGIGANTAVFSVVNGVLLRPIPFKDSGRLVLLWQKSPGLNIAQDWLSPAQYFDIKTGTDVFDQTAIAFVNTLNLTDLNSQSDPRPERIGGARVSSSLFALLGASPAMGRTFLSEEDQPGSPRTVIISNALWHRRFGADPAVLGKSLTIDGQDYEVVGIMPADFALNNETLPAYHPVENLDAFMPLPLPAGADHDRDHEDYTVVGKLRPGITAIQAQAQVDTVVARLRHDYPHNYPENAGFTISVVPMLEHAVGEIRPVLLVLLGAVAFVLLIACANVAGLLLSRAESRRKEIAVRTALGAGRMRLIRQLLTESVLLSLFGGALGLLLSLWATSALQALNAGYIPRAGDVNIDRRVMAFTLVTALITSLLFGLVPALSASRTDVNETLKEGGRGPSGAGHAPTRGALVVAEIALSLILLACAGLLIRSFIRLQQVSPGFATQNILSLRLSLAGSKYAQSAARRNFYRELDDRIRALPGVESVGAISELPLSGDLAWTPVWVEGYVARPGETLVQSDVHTAAGDYFHTMQIPLVSGRYFRDSEDSGSVAIVDESFAEHFLTGQEPIGHRLKLGAQSSQAPWITIVGLVKSVKQYGLDAQPRITCYFPHDQNTRAGMYMVVQAASTTGLLSALAAEVHALDSDLPIYDAGTIEQRVAGSLGRRRFSMLMLGGFAVLALLLAVIGIYGVVSYSVTQRTNEIGIRMALGASSGSVLRLILRQGLLLGIMGIGIGLAGAIVLTRLISGLLYGVSAADPLTFAAVSILLAAAAVAAQIIPARRAARVDPIIALRHE
jgi:predicted permease